MKKYLDKPWKLAAWIIILYLITSFLLGRVFLLLSSALSDVYLDYALLLLDLIIVVLASFEVGKLYIRFTKKLMGKQMIILATLYIAIAYAVKFILVEILSGEYAFMEDAPSLILFTAIYALVAYVALSIGNKK